jgi:hypothetical protein
LDWDLNNGYRTGRLDWDINTAKTQHSTTIEKQSKTAAPPSQTSIEKTTEVKTATEKERGADTTTPKGHRSAENQHRGAVAPERPPGGM